MLSRPHIPVYPPMLRTLVAWAGSAVLFAMLLWAGLHMGVMPARATASAYRAHMVVWGLVVVTGALSAYLFYRLVSRPPLLTVGDRDLLMTMPGGRLAIPFNRVRTVVLYKKFGQVFLGVRVKLEMPGVAPAARPTGAAKGGLSGGNSRGLSGVNSGAAQGDPFERRLKAAAAMGQFLIDEPVAVNLPQLLADTDLQELAAEIARRAGCEVEYKSPLKAKQRRPARGDP